MLLGIVVVVILIAVAIVFATSRRRVLHGAGTAQVPTTTAGAVATSGTRAGDTSGEDDDRPVTTHLFRAIAKRENPMVVAITTQARVNAVQPTDSSGPDDFFRRFFGDAEPRDQIRRALGSGFLISREGEILTNNHVVAGAQEIRVGLLGQDARTFKADVVGRDPLTDTALIKLENAPATLPVATLGNSSALAPGDWVMAIGNPFELGHTVTVGVISYSGRPFATTEGRFQNMLQTDASINPGNSGGPLIDTSGNVVGINSAILAGEGTGGNIGIGFAVPIDTVKELLPQLRQGRVHRGELGVQILSAPLAEDEAKSLGLPNPEGAIISRVAPHSPAADAGLRAGDVIVQFNGQRIKDSAQLTGLVVGTSSGTKVPITYYRNGQPQTTTATIDELRLEDDDGRADNGPSDHAAVTGFGLTLGNITPDLARQLQLPASTQGALVENVEPFTPAASSGLRPGDVIVQANRNPVQSAQDASRLLRQVKPGESAFLLLNRQGVQVFVNVRKE
jgi:Do/DeqQ family serine protease